MTTAMSPYQLNLFPLTVLKQFDKPLANKSSTLLFVREFIDAQQVEEILPVFAQFAQELPEIAGSYDPLMTRVSLARLLNNGVRDYENLFIIYKRGVAVGFALVSIAHSLYSDRKVSSMDLWYVSPALRGSRAALMLLTAYEQWAHERGATLAFTGSDNIQSAEKTTELLTKVGYTRVGSTLVKDLRNGEG